MPRIQAHRDIAVQTPLGEDVLLLRRFTGTERLGRLFEYRLDLLSENHEIKFDDLVGRLVTVRVDLSDGGMRYFNGYVNRFAQTGRLGRLSRYVATVVPWAWFLTRTADCRIFQEKSVPDIIQEVFDEHGFGEYDDSLTGSYDPRTYCVQYRESDFNFVSRLMEDEGIYYYFEHENGRHTLVMVDSAGSHAPYPGYAEVSYLPEEMGGSDAEHVRLWQIEEKVQTTDYALDDYDFTNPRKQLLASGSMDREHAMSGFEVFDYPGGYTEYRDGESYARIRTEELQSVFWVARGKTDARGVCTGYTFELTDHPRKDQRGEYLVVDADYEFETDDFDADGQALGRGPVYSCEFRCIGSKEPFRPARTTRKPVVEGPQTAIVVGKSGEEIWTDRYGRVKVQFHWDRYGENDENSSCWIRCAQSVAGKRWGSMYIPRIGQEVVVEFLEGDPDRPLITGCVYNGDQMPAYLGEGPDGEHGHDPHLSGVKTNSTKGGSGFNEIRFDDTAGEEQIFIHGQKDLDMRVTNDLMEAVENDRHLIVQGNQRESVDGSKDLAVGGNHTEHVKGNTQITTDGNLDEVVGANKKELVNAGKNVHIKGDLKEKVDMGAALEVGTNQHCKVGMVHALEAGQEVHLKAGMNVVVEAGLQLTLKGPGGFITVGPAGVAIQGTMVMVNSGGAAGVGTPANPQPAEDAADAQPAQPKEADDSKTGYKSAY
jgi:type VI secretion system secreted protein VgrG